MKTSQKTPAWAIELVNQVCNDYKRTLPEVLSWKALRATPKWTYYRDGSRRLVLPRTSSSGTTYKEYVKSWRPYKLGKGKIHVTAGKSLEDQKLVLLHELAHWIVIKNKTQGHTSAFWDLAFELYKRYDVGLDKAYEREKHYRKQATVAYQRALTKE